MQLPPCQLSPSWVVLERTGVQERQHPMKNMKIGHAQRSEHCAVTPLEAEPSSNSSGPTHAYIPVGALCHAPVAVRTGSVDALSK
jgi:hypothetical protein